MTEADDLNVLMPDQVTTIAGKEITVHEYTFAEQLQHRQVLRPIADVLAGLLANTEKELELDSLTDALAVVYTEVTKAVAISCGQSVEWVSELRGQDAETLLLVWWGVNARFFTRQAMLPKMQQLARSLFAGPTSSRP